MKKYIAFIVAFVLLVVAIIVPQASADGIKAGKGSKDNDEVESYKDLMKVDLSDGATFYMSGEATKDLSESGKGYQSAGKELVVFNSEYYVSKKAQYIVVDATVYYSSSAEYDDYDIDYSGASSYSISYEIFESSKKELVRINRYDNPTQDQAAIALYLGKWVEWEADYFEFLELLEDINEVAVPYELISMIFYTDKSDWDEKGSSIVLDDDMGEEFAEEFFESFNKDDEFTADVEVDFSDKDAPKFTISAKAKYEDEDDSGKVDIDAGANFIRYEMVMTNIGNTSIEENINKNDIITEKKMKNKLKDTGLWDRYFDNDDDEEDDD